jgi:hypothetical protein
LGRQEFHSFNVDLHTADKYVREDGDFSRYSYPEPYCWNVGQVLFCQLHTHIFEKGIKFVAEGPAWQEFTPGPVYSFSLFPLPSSSLYFAIAQVVKPG